MVWNQNIALLEWSQLMVVTTATSIPIRIPMLAASS
jgi:hypothetical protein